MNREEITKEEFQFVLEDSLRVIDRQLESLNEQRRSIIFNLEKVYLGDAVYAKVVDSESISLATENGIETTNEIFLNKEVISNLIQYLKDIKRYE